MNQRLSSLEAKVNYLESKTNQRMLLDSPSITLKPDTKEFSFLETDAARLPISLQNVEAFANGSRVTLHIGNSTNATITKLSFLVQWGPVKAGEPVYSPENSKRMTIDTLEPGAWKVAELTLAAVPPAQLGFVGLSHAGVDSLSLSRK